MSARARTPDELLSRARDGAEPDAGEAGRVRARLRAQISAASPSSDPPLAMPAPLRDIAEQGAAPSRLAPALRRALLGAAGAVLFGAGFLLGRFSTVSGDTTAQSAASTLVAPAPAANAASPATASPVTSRSPTEPELRAPPRSIPPRSIPPLDAPPRSARPRAAAAAEATSEPLKEALRRLRRAQRALYDDDAARALAVLDDLDRRIAPAVLGEEREMTRILALCGTGELEEARALAGRWVAEHPQSIYLARLQNSCVEPVEDRGRR